MQIVPLAARSREDEWQAILGEVIKFLAETTKTRMEVGTSDVNGGNGIRVDVG